ncbi:hypothetical protein HWB57_gp147 [Erwinia phage vB_EamM-Bue1]|uniref:Uncharacterized protein n=1 Tax=Erwinia phage vB_EamM-Bue1 TaxID=2099338 RepID=A0A2P1JUF3_9CAUD|nr:hypothetical protein HWB57_gp147 [Erwinia phage vB_EamM-Bue1]AVO22984.1 hypothetical protein [Erwinia phage vB_EamM-Bue1]
MFSQPITCCKWCAKELSYEYEETASYIPHMMWQVCPKHGRVSFYRWSPGHQLERPLNPFTKKLISWSEFRKILEEKKLLP